MNIKVLFISSLLLLSLFSVEGRGDKLIFSNEVSEIETSEKKHQELILKVFSKKYKADYSKAQFQRIDSKTALKWVKKNEINKISSVNKVNRKLISKLNKDKKIDGYLITKIEGELLKEILLLYNEYDSNEENKNEPTYIVITDMSHYTNQNDEEEEEEPETSTYGYAADLTSSASFPPEDYGSGGSCPCMQESVPAGEGGGNCAETC